MTLMAPLSLLGACDSGFTARMRC